MGWEWGSLLLLLVVVVIRSAGEQSESQSPYIVYLVPHSHLDPGWLESYHGYYKTRVSQIMHSVMKVLRNAPSRRFTLCETSFLALYWEELEKEGDTEGLKFLQKVVQEGRVEVAGGGWVQHDEALVTVDAQLRQMRFGLEWLRARNFSTPRVAWQIDVFGHSDASPFVFGSLGMRDVVLNRIPYNLKARWTHTQGMEFRWRSRSQHHRDTVLAHVLYDHYTFPSVFSRLRHTFMEKEVEAEARHLLQQVAPRILAYPTRHLMVLLGDDFRWSGEESNEIRFSNIEALIKYVNSPSVSEEWFASTGFPGRVQLVMATPTQYFRALRAELADRSPLSLVEGPLLPYSSVPTSIWSGFYGTRPFLKQKVRRVDAAVRGAEKLLSLTLPTPDTARHRSLVRQEDLDEAGVSMKSGKMLDEARRDSLVCAHHDAITGTSRTHVIADFHMLADRAYSSAATIIDDTLDKLLTREASSKSATIRETCLPATDMHLEERELREEGMDGFGLYNNRNGDDGDRADDMEGAGKLEGSRRDESRKGQRPRNRRRSTEYWSADIANGPLRLRRPASRGVQEGGETIHCSALYHTNGLRSVGKVLPLIFFNDLAFDRVELVHVVVDCPDVRILNADGREIPHQISPSFSFESVQEGDGDHLPGVAHYRLHWEALLAANSASTWYVTAASSSPDRPEIARVTIRGEVGEHLSRSNTGEDTNMRAIHGDTVSIYLCEDGVRICGAILREQHAHENQGSMLLTPTVIEQVFNLYRAPLSGPYMLRTEMGIFVGMGVWKPLLVALLTAVTTRILLLLCVALSVKAKLLSDSQGPLPLNSAFLFLLTVLEHLTLFCATSTTLSLGMRLKSSAGESLGKGLGVLAGLILGRTFPSRWTLSLVAVGVSGVAAGMLLQQSLHAIPSQIELQQAVLVEGALFDELSVSFTIGTGGKETEFCSQVLRVLHTDSLRKNGEGRTLYPWHVEMSLQTRSLASHELMLRFITSLRSDGVWSTDNGLFLSRHVRTILAFLPEHVFPTQSISRIADSVSASALYLISSVATGATSLADGQLEVMLHRRPQRDDGAGMAEGVDKTMNAPSLSTLLLVLPSSSPPPSVRQTSLREDYPLWLRISPCVYSSVKQHLEYSYSYFTTRTPDPKAQLHFPWVGSGAHLRKSGALMGVVHYGEEGSLPSGMRAMGVREGQQVGVHELSGLGPGDAPIGSLITTWRTRPEQQQVARGDGVQPAGAVLWAPDRTDDVLSWRRRPASGIFIVFTVFIALGLFRGGGGALLTYLRGIGVKNKAGE